MWRFVLVLVVSPAILTLTRWQCDTMTLLYPCVSLCTNRILLCIKSPGYGAKPSETVVLDSSAFDRRTKPQLY